MGKDKTNTHKNTQPVKVLRTKLIERDGKKRIDGNKGSPSKELREPISRYFSDRHMYIKTKK